MSKKVINIIDIDSKIPNLALAKVKKYYEDKGYDVVSWDYLVGKVPTYVSCIFDWNKDKVSKFEGKPDCFIGGTGYDYTIKLPEEIENTKPRINFGFTSRGCIRKCKFCLVPLKEGRIHAIGDIYDIWDGKSNQLIIMDNNILALPEHFKLICSQLKKEKIKVDFNQGLDIRLLTEDLAKELYSISKLTDVRFAWDNIKDENKILKGIETLRKGGINRGMFYVLVGFDSTFEEDLYRFNILKGLNQRAYCMRYKTVRKNPLYQKLAGWVNSQNLFMKLTFDEFLQKANNYKTTKGFFNE